MEKLNQSVHCSQGFPQTVITSDYFQCVGFGSKNSIHCACRVQRSVSTCRVQHRRYLVEPYLNSFTYLGSPLLAVAA